MNLFMHQFLGIIAEVALPESPATAGQSSTVPPESFWDPASVVVCTAGLCVGIIWLFWCGGFRTLRKAPLRRHHWWLAFWPLLILLFWLSSLSVILEIIAALEGSNVQSSSDATRYFVSAILQIGLIATMLIIAHKAFARRLRGFGLNFRTIHKDTGYAVVNLLAVYPLIIFFLVAVTYIGQVLKGDFEIEKHQTLTFLSENSSIIIKAMTILTVVVIVPVFEEMVFRGFLQSTLRSATTPWTAVLVVSSFFALFHYPNYAHMPSLFFLSCGLGYAYERSGSLLRPILMHIFFNGTSVAMTFLTA
jgi:membrane protease YdiL (CAAX protease family)